jgi:hypothetical protein
VVRRLLYPLLDLALVTPVLLTYGPSRWSWLAGPLSALAMWVLAGAGGSPVTEAPPRHAGRQPAQTLPR